MKKKIEKILDAINKNNVVVLEFASMHALVDYFNGNNNLLCLSFIYDNLMFECDTFIDIPCRLSITNAGIGLSITNTGDYFKKNIYLSEWLLKENNYEQ